MTIGEPLKGEPHKWANNRRAQGEDFFETPRIAVEALLPFVPSTVKTIWEPTVGLEAISSVLDEHGFSTVVSDKYPKFEGCPSHDFLTDPFLDCEGIVLNPPFSFKTEFLQRLIESGKWFAMLVPLSIIETKKRSTMFADNRLSIINLSNRICYTGRYSKKVYFHSVWVVNDGLGRIHYAAIN